MSFFLSSLVLPLTGSSGRRVFFSWRFTHTVRRRPVRVVAGRRARVHGRYRRRVRDAPMGGSAVVLEVLVRRFRCQNAACAVVTSVEQVPGLTRPFGRHTPGLEAMLASIGLALAGRAGARLAAVLGIQVGRDTLLRRVRALLEPPVGPVKVLGVDDFAFAAGTGTAPSWSTWALAARWT